MRTTEDEEKKNPDVLLATTLAGDTLLKLAAANSPGAAAGTMIHAIVNVILFVYDDAIYAEAIIALLQQQAAFLLGHASFDQSVAEKKSVIQGLLLQYEILKYNEWHYHELDFEEWVRRGCPLG